MTDGGSWLPAWGLATLAGLVVFASRVPAILFPRELNADEGQMLAQAMRAAVDPLPWRGFDGTTSGPFNTWFLLVARPTYSAAHLLAALGWTLTVACGFVTAARLFGRTAAAIATSAAVAWLAVNQGADFVHYSSETLSVALLSAALAAGASDTRHGHLFAAVLLGIVPWAKLQAAPLAAVMGIWLVADALRASRKADGGDQSSAVRRLPSVAIIIGTAALPTVAMTIATWRGGVLGEMWESYFVANARYAGSLASGEFWAGAGAMFLSWPLCPWILALALLAGIVRGKEPWQAAERFALGLAAVSLCACLRPALRLQHHQLLMLPSLILLTAVVVRRLETRCAAPRLRWWAAMLLVSYTAWRAGEAWSTLRQRADALSRPTSASVVLQDVHAVAPGAHSLLAWGWFPSLYVQGGIVPPTRHVISQLLDAGLPGEGERRATFLAELAAAPPDVLVDSSERGMERMFGLSPHMAHFPELARFVRANYGETASVATPSGPVRIFVRKGWHEHEAGGLHADD